MPYVTLDKAGNVSGENANPSPDTVEVKDDDPGLLAWRARVADAMKEPEPASAPDLAARIDDIDARLKKLEGG